MVWNSTMNNINELFSDWLMLKVKWFLRGLFFSNLQKKNSFLIWRKIRIIFFEKVLFLIYYQVLSILHILGHLLPGPGPPAQGKLGKIWRIGCGFRGNDSTLRILLWFSHDFTLNELDLVLFMAPTNMDSHLDIIP